MTDLDDSQCNIIMHKYRYRRRKKSFSSTSKGQYWIQTSPIKESPLMPLEPLDTEAPENGLELKEDGCCYENTVFIGEDSLLWIPVTY